MKVIFGGMSLLVVLALVAWLSVRQMNVGAPRSASMPSGASAPLRGEDLPRTESAQQRVRADLDRAMQEAAEARRRGADQ